MDAATIISWSEQELWLPLKLVSNSSIPIRLRLQMKYDPLYPYIGALWAELYLHPLDLATLHIFPVFLWLYRNVKMCQILDRRPHAVTILLLSLCFHKIGVNSIYLSQSCVINQGLGQIMEWVQGSQGWNTYSVQRISGRKRNIHRALFLKIFSKVADNPENKLTKKSFSDYLICLIILKKSETFSWRETLSVWYPKRRKKMRENMRMSEGFWTDNKTLILDWAGVIITKRFLNLSSWPYSESPCIIKISYHCLSGLRTARLILDAFKIKSIT